MLLDDICVDITAKAVAGQFSKLLGRENELSQLSRLLTSNQTQPCVMITGDPGVGKSALVEGLAERAASGVEPSLTGIRILQLDLNALVAGTMYRGDLENRLHRVIREAAGNRSLVIFIDEFHVVDKVGGPECNIAESLKPSLARGDISLIAATTTQDYDKLAERDPALVRRFVRIDLKELGKEATMAAMRQVAQELSANTGLVCDDSVLESVIDLTDRYVRNRRFPDKALSALRQIFLEKNTQQSDKPKAVDLQKTVDFAQQQILLLKHRNYQEAYKCLGEWVGSDAANNNRRLTVDDVKHSLESMCKVPLSKMEDESFDRKILDLGTSLKALVISQDRAINSVADCFKRMAVGLRRPNAPIGSFVFVGPTGVGKTELAKSLAKVLWGSEDRMIRFDMSEFMEEHTVSKLIGSPPGYVGHDEPGLLTKAIIDNPYAVLLFDEIEKAHPRIANILLQVLDDGRLTDSKGQTAMFSDAIIIMTSNVGSLQIAKLGRQEIEQEYEDVLKRVRSMLCAAFSPELVNRVDQIVVFSPFDQDDLGPILKLISSSYNERIRDQRGIDLKFTDAAMSFIISRYYDPDMGARPLRRGLESIVYAQLSDSILRGQFVRGDVVKVDAGPQGITLLKEGL